MSARSTVGGAVFGFVVVATSVARGGFVTVHSAEARITFFDPNGAAPNTRTRSVALGDLDQFVYDGGVPGDARGNGLVFYSLAPFKNAFQLFVEVKHETFASPDGAGGNASFELSFTTSVPLSFTFESNVLSPPAFFSAVIQPVEATAQFAGDNTWTGTIPNVTNDQGEVEFQLFEEHGVIPAGTTSFLTVDAVTYNSAFGPTPAKSDGYVRFNVEPLPQAIPLPPAVWPAAGCLAMAWLAGVGRARLRRAAAG